MLASRRGKSLVPEALSPPKAAPALAASAPAGSIFAGVKHGGGAHTSHGHGLAPQMDTLNQAPQNPQLLRIMRGSPMVGSIGPSADSNEPPETEKSWTVKEEDAARLGVALFGENWASILNNTHFSIVLGGRSPEELAAHWKLISRRPPPRAVYDIPTSGGEPPSSPSPRGAPAPALHRAYARPGLSCATVAGNSAQRGEFAADAAAVGARSPWQHSQREREWTAEETRGLFTGLRVHGYNAKQTNKGLGMHTLIGQPAITLTNLEVLGIGQVVVTLPWFWVASHRPRLTSLGSAGGGNGLKLRGRLFGLGHLRRQKRVRGSCLWELLREKTYREAMQGRHCQCQGALPTNS